MKGRAIAMDAAQFVTIITGVLAVVSLHLKNRLQDTIAAGLRNDLSVMAAKLEECERRHRDAIDRLPPRKKNLLKKGRL